jgi:hypothetical protein
MFADRFSSLWGLVAPNVTWRQIRGASPRLYFGSSTLILVAWWISCLVGAWYTRLRRTRLEDPAFQAIEPTFSYRTRTLAAWASCFAVLTCWLTFGDKAFLYRALSYLPIVGHFRVPWRYGILTTLCVAIVAGLAFAQLVSMLRSGRKSSWTSLILPWTAVVLSIAVAIWSGFRLGPAKQTPHLFSLLAIGPLFVCLTALALTFATRGHRFGLLAICVLTVVDFGLFTTGTTKGQAFWKQMPSYRDYRRKTPAPPPQRTARVADFAPFINLCLFRDIRTVNGYVAMRPRRLLDYQRLDVLRVSGVSYYRRKGRRRFRPEFSHPDQVPLKLKPLGPALPGGWYPIPDPLPRARLVSAVHVSTNPARDLKRIDPATTAIVTSPLSLSCSPPGSAVLKVDRPGRIVVNSRATGRQLLVISESYHPGWQARLDGRPTGLERVYGDFIGCVVPPGKSRVEFVFRPLSLWLGKLISLLSLAACLLLLSYRHIASLAKRVSSH